MKNSLIFMISIFCFLTLHAVTPSNAYSASVTESILFGGKSLDEFLDNVERSRLKGIDTVNIVIEGMSDSARELGINKESIRTAVEIKIRKAGIKVNEKKSDAWFYVNVGFSSPINRLYGVTVSVKVKTMVSLIRDPKITFLSTIWEKEIFGISGELKVKEGVKETVEELVDEYILDYLKAKEN
jgi:hypothetical protein